MVDVNPEKGYYWSLFSLIIPGQSNEQIILADDDEQAMIAYLAQYKYSACPTLQYN